MWLPRALCIYLQRAQRDNNCTIKQYLSAKCYLVWCLIHVMMGVWIYGAAWAAALAP